MTDRDPAEHFLDLVVLFRRAGSSPGRELIQNVEAAASTLAGEPVAAVGLSSVPGPSQTVASLELRPLSTGEVEDWQSFARRHGVAEQRVAEAAQEPPD